MTPRWHYRRSGVILPCASKAAAQRLAAQLLPDLLTRVSVKVIEEAGKSYVTQEVVYYTHEGAIPYDVPDVSEQDQ